MFSCEALSQDDDEELNHNLMIELGEYGIRDSEYEKGIAKIVEDEVTRTIEINRQTQSIEPSSGLLDVY